MDILINVLYIILGFVLLVKGGDYLVDGAVAIARRARLSSMVIGLTIMGFGTSAPELLVSAQAALGGASGIAVGNVVGSNIANIALILGLTAIIRVCKSSKQTLVVDTPFMVLSCVLMVAVGLTGTIGRVAGIVGVALLVAFVAWQVVNSRKNPQPEEENPEPIMALWKALLIVVCSIAALVFGSDKLVEGACGIAKLLGVSERVIGLTVVAVGTSLPELFASVMAARKGETDMAIGNIIGSVTFNVLSVIGVSAAICPITNISDGFDFDFGVMVGLAFLLWYFLYTKRALERWEGGALLLVYVLFLAHTVVVA